MQSHPLDRYARVQIDWGLDKPECSLHFTPSHLMLGLTAAHTISK